MKFIHAADLHLDSPFLGLQQLPKVLRQEIQKAPYEATERMVTDAISSQVDFVLLAGDLFDRETQSVSAQLFLNAQLTRLIQAGIKVVLSFGNHDYLSQDRYIGLPEEVYHFGADVDTVTFQLDDQRVAISGFSYDQRWLIDDQIPNFPARGSEDFHIGLLHGAQKQGSLNHYAPFTIGELQLKHYDYWALGHIHKPQQLSETPPIIYPGTIQGRHKLESGEHGYERVTTDDAGRLVTQFVPASSVVWQTVSLKVDESTTDQSLMTSVLARLPTSPKFKLIEVKLAGIEQLSTGLLERLNNGDWLTRFDDQQKGLYQQNQSWVYAVSTIPTDTAISYSQLDERYWSNAYGGVFNDEQIRETAGKLMQVPFIAAHLEQKGTTAAIADMAKSELLTRSKMEADLDADHKA